MVLEEQNWIMLVFYRKAQDYEIEIE